MPPEPPGAHPPGQPEALDLDTSLRQDEKEDLRRRLGETTEQLAAAHAKDCPSCGAEFTKGVGAVGKKKTDDKAEEKPAKKPAAKPAAKAAEKPAETPSEPDDDERGFGFFE